MGYIMMILGIQLAIGLFFLCFLNFPMLTAAVIIFFILQDLYVVIRSR